MSPKGPGGFHYIPFELKAFIEVPATDGLIDRNPALPLNGRLTGTWVEPGAANQGFQLSISEQVGRRTDFAPGIPELPPVIFFSQYTFDAESRPLWLVGNAEFEPGATRVTLPVFRVSDGQFRGGKPADRERIGQVTLTSWSCNDVAFRCDCSASFRWKRPATTAATTKQR